MPRSIRGRCIDCEAEAEIRPPRLGAPPPLPRKRQLPPADSAHISEPADWAGYIREQQETIEQAGGPWGVVLVAYLFLGYSQEEIAERFDHVPQGTVSRAVSQLRKAGVRLPGYRKRISAA